MQFPLQIKDKLTFEQMNTLNKSVFGLSSTSESLLPKHINKNC